MTLVPAPKTNRFVKSLGPGRLLTQTHAKRRKEKDKKKNGTRGEKARRAEESNQDPRDSTHQAHTPALKPIQSIHASECKCNTWSLQEFNSRENEVKLARQS
jgi:hypothetical protein